MLDGIQQYETAIFEAKRFIKRAEDAIAELNDHHRVSYTSKANAAAKRSSMDLSNALVQIRK